MSSSYSAAYRPIKYVSSKRLGLDDDHRQLDRIGARQLNQSVLATPPGKAVRQHSSKPAEGEDLVLSRPEDIPTKWSKQRSVGAGYYNLGNTCFMNAVLQALAHTAPLAEMCLSSAPLRPGSRPGSASSDSSNGRSHLRDGKFDVIGALRAHVRNALGAAGRRVIKPAQFAHNLRAISKSFRLGRQEDSHEFLRCLLDQLHEACIRGLRPKPLPQRVQDTTFVSRIFGGRLRSQVKCCDCGYESNTYDPCMDISLEIPRAGGVARALQHFVRGETLDGDNRYICPKQKTKVRAVRSLRIDRLPLVLTLHLKRFAFGGFGSKIGRAVEYEDALDMAAYTTGASRTPQWYDLYAVLVHAGSSMNSGHYYSYVKAPGGQWYCCDDGDVSPVSTAQAMSQRAYILFYRKRSPEGTHARPTLETPLSRRTSEDVPDTPTSRHGATLPMGGHGGLPAVTATYSAVPAASHATVGSRREAAATAVAQGPSRRGTGGSDEPAAERSAGATKLRAHASRIKDGLPPSPSREGQLTQRLSSKNWEGGGGVRVGKTPPAADLPATGNRPPLDQDGPSASPARPRPPAATHPRPTPPTVSLPRASLRGSRAASPTHTAARLSASSSSVTRLYRAGHQRILQVLASWVRRTGHLRALRAAGRRGDLEGSLRVLRAVQGTGKHASPTGAPRAVLTRARAREVLSTLDAGAREEPTGGGGDDDEAERKPARVVASGAAAVGMAARPAAAAGWDGGRGTGAAQRDVVRTKRKSKRTRAYDEWEEEYDRGKVKKVKNKEGGQGDLRQGLGERLEQFARRKHNHGRRDRAERPHATRKPPRQ
ncbi:unnamed protein product [Pedinophyceae sp. YPF-701]|nr:unnamed protein product [Pedinophyceae sp. YPF-701]